ncbi:MAG: GAF domain-containing protein [Anaerolineae bacterium]
MTDDCRQKPALADSVPPLDNGPAPDLADSTRARRQIKELTARLEQRDQELAAMKRDLQRLNTLLSLVEAMSSELDLSPLLQKMVISAVELLGAEQGAIGLVDEERNAIRHRALHNLPEALFDIDFAEGVGISGQAYALKRPVIVRDYGNQVQIPIDDGGMRQIKAALSVPIWWHGRLIGVFSIGTSAGNRVFDGYDVDVLSLFAKHAAIAIEKARLYAEADRLAHLEERNRIARELHDSVTQSLFTIVLMADAVRNFLRTGQEDPAPTAELLYQTARDALTEMRALIYELRPAALEGEGLITALRKLASAVQTRHELPVEVRQQGVRRLSQEQEEALFRIAQEALYNVIKHAQAGRAVIELRLTEKEAQLTVTDDGVGFNPRVPMASLSRQTARTGLGLTTMSERAEQLNGCLNVRSAPDRGTQVRVRVPLLREERNEGHTSPHRG